MIQFNGIDAAYNQPSTQNPHAYKSKTQDRTVLQPTI